MQALLQARIALPEHFELIDSPARAMVRCMARVSYLGRHYIFQRECKGSVAERMSKCQTIRTPSISLLILSLGLSLARGGLISGLYQISSGSYNQCCGFAGEISESLPNSYQAFIELTIEVQSKLAKMSVLSSDKQTVFSIPGFETNEFTYMFTNGVVFSNYIQFGDPFPPMPRPDETVVSFLVSNSVDGLRIEGVVMRPYTCCDIPNVFTHTNVVANLFPGSARPIINPPTVSSNGAVALRVWNGQAGETNVIEASIDLVHWTPIDTNIFPPTTCPLCPYLDFEDTAATNFGFRSYRAFLIR